MSLEPEQISAAFLKLLSSEHGTRDEAATAILDAIVTVYTPEQFGRDFDRLIKLPEPLESWDDKAAEWLYARVLELLDSIDFDRNPEAIGARAWRKAKGLTKRESSAAARLLEMTEGDAQGRAAVNVLVSLNARELKRRDPLWLLKQALRNAKHPEAIASIERAIAMESK
jgi:hypothetical protein